LAAGLLVFVEVTKELPLTMLFQRFNFETLAVRAYTLMQTDGAIYDSSVPALIIVLLGLIPVFALNRLMK
ncbi:MAG: iron ABC transporter permease, partial [Bacteroidota bacterium]